MAPGAIHPTFAPSKDKSTSPSHTKVLGKLNDAISRFEHRNPKSKALHEKAVFSLPGGNTRTLLHTSPFPICITRGRNHSVYDEDEHEYTDLVGELTAGLYGHSNPIILETIKATLDNVGLSLGATTSQEAQYADLLCQRFGLDRVRFCNSGTEANLHALAAARRYTGKRKIVAFKGGYHGAVLSFGSGVAANNVDIDDWVMARYNDISSAKAAIETEGIAAVIVEAMQGSGGCIPASKEFLATIQESAENAGVIFILDEVMTSRLAPNGLKSTLNLSPDLTTFGKYLGGGLAFGAFGGNIDVMAVYDPRLSNSISHSGTFNNNTLAMHAGYAGLTQVYTPDECIKFTAMGERFRQELQRVSKGTKCSWTGLGTLMNVHFFEDGVWREDVNERNDMKDLFWLEMLEQGFWVTRRGMIALILGTPQHELNRFVRCVEAFLKGHDDCTVRDN